LPRHRQEPSEYAESHDHVQGVEAGHDEIKREEDLGVLRVGVWATMSGNLLVVETETYARNVVLFEFVFVLDALDAEEGDAEEHSENEHQDHQPATSGLCGPDGENDRQTAADQDSRVGGAERRIDGLAGSGEVSEIPAAV